MSEPKITKPINKVPPRKEVWEKSSISISAVVAHNNNPTSVDF